MTVKHVTIPDTWTRQQATAVAAFLERVIEAIWRAHGPEMASFMADATLRPPRLPTRRPTRAPLPPLLDDDILF